jgi:hypothetical protein
MAKKKKSHKRSPGTGKKYCTKRLLQKGGKKKINGKMQTVYWLLDRNGHRYYKEPRSIKQILSYKRRSKSGKRCTLNYRKGGRSTHQKWAGKQGKAYPRRAW